MTSRQVEYAVDCVVVEIQDIQHSSRAALNAIKEKGQTLARARLADCRAEMMSATAASGVSNSY